MMERMLDELLFIEPEWKLPPGVQAFSTTRIGGVSRGCYAGLNLGAHVGDSPDDVIDNRAALQRALHLHAPPVWLDQVHGSGVVNAALVATDSPVTADAAFTSQPGIACAVMTADCLPVLFADRQGGWVCAAHAGWRGLLAGVLEASIQHYPGSTERLAVWLGPAIGPDAFEVGEEVVAQFAGRYPDCGFAFLQRGANKYLLDIYALARHILALSSVRHVFGGHYCTFSDAEKFYSYRRDGVTGRMASIIWLANSD